MTSKSCFTRPFPAGEITLWLVCGCYSYVREKVDTGSRLKLYFLVLPYICRIRLKADGLVLRDMSIMSSL